MQIIPPDVDKDFIELPKSTDPRLASTEFVDFYIANRIGKKEPNAAVDTMYMNRFKGGIFKYCIVLVDMFSKKIHVNQVIVS